MNTWNINMTEEQVAQLKKILVLQDKTEALLNINHDDPLFSLSCYFFIKGVLTDISIAKNIKKDDCRYITKRKAEINIGMSHIDIFNYKKPFNAEMDIYFNKLKNAYEYLMINVNPTQMYFLIPHDKSILKEIINKLIEWEAI